MIPWNAPIRRLPKCLRINSSHMFKVLGYFSCYCTFFTFVWSTIESASSLIVWRGNMIMILVYNLRTWWLCVIKDLQTLISRLITIFVEPACSEFDIDVKMAVLNLEKLRPSFVAPWPFPFVFNFQIVCSQPSLKIREIKIGFLSRNILNQFYLSFYHEL